MTSIRTMTPDDVAEGLDLCRLAGWNQKRQDWLRMLALAPEGMFVDERDGRVVGTGSAIHYDTRIGWIGMVLVHPEYRRRGIASAIMGRCIDFLRGRGIQSIKLDATDQGRPVYAKLGFRDEQPIVRYVGPPRKAGRATADAGVRPIGPDDWPHVARLDDEAFGADRLGLLKDLATEGLCVVLFQGDRLRAYGFVRPGHNAASVGPLVAVDDEAARTVADSLLAELPQAEAYWDVLPANVGAARLAESCGLAVGRRLTRMVLGEVNHCGRTDLVHAVAGFELG